MRSVTLSLAAAAAIGGLSAPAAAQYPYPQPYPQQYPQAYPQQPYGYGQQGYTTTNPVQQIIDSLLGNRYTVTDRQAVSQCASAAVVQAQAQYRGYGAYGQQGYGYQRGYGYQQGYAGRYGQAVAAPALRVTAITAVQRRSNGLRVKGLMSSGTGTGTGAYGQRGYADPRYASQGDLSFRCNVDYRGQVSDIRIGRAVATGYRRY